MGPLQSAHATKTRMHAQWHKDVCLDIENIWLVVPTCLKTGSSFSREACKKHVTYICYICIYISKQTIKLETFGTMMFRTLGTVIAFSPEPPLVSHWLVATVLETSPHVASRWKSWSKFPLKDWKFLLQDESKPEVFQSCRHIPGNAGCNTAFTQLLPAGCIEPHEEQRNN